MFRQTRHAVELGLPLRVDWPALAAKFRTWSLAHLDMFALLFLTGLSGALHFWRLHLPAEPVFDEVYFPVFARNYLDGTPFFDAHPPLGKYLIAIGIRFFGFTPLGYRAVDALFGIGLVLLVYRLSRALFRNRKIAFLAGVFAALDGLLLVESRAGLINIFAVCFALAAYDLFLRSTLQADNRPHRSSLFGAGVCAGAAAAVKWVGAASLGVLWVLVLAARLHHRFTGGRWTAALASRFDRIHAGSMAGYLLHLFLVPVLVYSVSFIPHLLQNPEFDFVELHRQMFGYHSHLQEGHHYASPWWSWPLVLRPVSYFWQVDAASGQATSILNIGNPVLWWLALPALVFALWQALRRRTFGLLFVLLAYAAHYFPFVLISRATFSYHYMGALPFAIIAVAQAMIDLWERGGWRRELAAISVLAILACAAYFLPLWLGLPLPAGAFYQRMWLQSWI